MVAPSVLDDFVLNLLARAAEAAERCPTNLEIARCMIKARLVRHRSASSIPGIITRLTRIGHVTVRVYGHNWRDVTITKTGKTTQPPPHGGQPYVTIDLNGRRTRS